MWLVVSNHEAINLDRITDIYPDNDQRRTCLVSQVSQPDSEFIIDVPLDDVLEALDRHNLTIHVQEVE